MDKPKLNNHLFKLVVSVILIFSFSLSSCTQISVVTGKDTNPEYPKAEVVFQVRTPSALTTGESLVLEILDDVTGLFFNPQKYEMTPKDGVNYFVRIPLVIGSDIKYRFTRISGGISIEYTPQANPVRYRILKVVGPTLVDDTISGWLDQPYNGLVGRIQGQLIDKETNAPIPNQLVLAAGMQTISASDGSFILENLPVGRHNLVIMSLDGAYDTFQQGAVIAEQATTPVNLLFKKRPVSDVTFTVDMPKDFVSELPLRFVSNLYSQGNAYADLSAGSSSIASNLPALEKTSESRYSIKLSLPVGFDLKYKYSFGDGFWNSELNDAGSFVVRELIISASETAVKNQVATFITPNFNEIQFEVKTPTNTPANEFVSLQLNPFGWMEPIRMVRSGENAWKYSLFSPLNMIGSVEYRFCRNDQCNSAINMTSGAQSFAAQATPQQVNVEITDWVDLLQSSSPTSVDTDGGSLQPRPSFIAGVELVPDLPISWKSLIDPGLQAAKSLGADWVVLTPTWTATRVNPPMFEQVPGTDLLWSDTQNALAHLKLAGLNSILFPRINFLPSSDQFWNTASKDTGWWQTFYDRYQRFIVHNADLAAVMDVDGFMIGDPGMTLAMSSASMPDGQPAAVPANADELWSKLITEIRARFTGQVIGVISLPSTATSLPAWLNDVDVIYVLFTPQLTGSDPNSIESIKTVFSQQLDEIVFPVSSQFNKPIIIGLNNSSTNSTMNGCVAFNDQCTDDNAVELDASQIDLALQAKVYNAGVIVSADRPWINGFISRGYSPFAVVQGKSSSIYGKPANDVLWFWYHFILNKAP